MCDFIAARKENKNACINTLNGEGKRSGDESRWKKERKSVENTHRRKE